MNRIRAYRLALTGAAAALAIAGCGSGSSDPTKTTSAVNAKPGAAAPIADTLPKPKSPGAHPGAKVDTLVVKDLVKGNGPALEAGDTAIVNFLATDWISGKRIDFRWGKKTKAPIDQGKVIDGWWQGIPGMRVGGRRVLLVPPGLFGTNSNAGTSPVTNGSITGYFVIDLVGIVPAQPPSAPGAPAH